MESGIWIPYVCATALVLVIPGPTIILVVSQAVAHGRRSVLPLVAGVLLGDFTAMTLSFVGLGAILAASAGLFLIFKWIGALYLIFLGIKLWRMKPESGAVSCRLAEQTTGALFRSSYVVTALNPKGIAFFVAFLPQFVNPRQPALGQFVLLGATFLLLAVVNATFYALFAGQLREMMGRSRVRSWFNRCGGSALIGAGIFTAGLKRSM